MGRSKKLEAFLKFRQDKVKEILEKSSKKKISVIVPCFNAEKDLPVLAKELQEMVWDLEEDFEFEVVLVNDGSTDGTLAEMNAFDVVGVQKFIVSYQKNSGLGCALRQGFAIATGDYLFVLDSDASYSPKCLNSMLNRMRESDCDIVTVSPYIDGGGVKGVPKNRLILSKGCNFLYRLLSGIKVHTFTAMVRLYKDSVKNVSWQNNGFLSQAEILIRAHNKGFKVCEVPAVLEIKAGRKSSMKVFNTMVSHLKFLGKVLLWRIFP